MSTGQRNGRYRVVHREGTSLTLLGEISDVPEHHSSLEPFVSGLLRQGARGLVMLVDAETGRVVVRRNVQPFSSRAVDRFRAS